MKILLIAGGSLAFALGAVGVFVPVLPTTPFILLAAFLFSKSSKRIHSWIVRSRVYRAYVAPFKEAGGMLTKDKARMLVVSYVVLGISAALVRQIHVWIILGAVAVFLFYLVCIRIPTVDEQKFINKAALQKEAPKD